MKKLIGTLSLMPLMAFATTWYVDGTTGADENSGTSPSEAKATIQAAIDVSSDNDTILVAPGTYSEVTTGDKVIFVIGIKGCECTIIDGAKSHRCVEATNLETNDGTNSVFVGFTLRNGYASGSGSDEYGGGARNGSYKRCAFVDNECSRGGGGAVGAYLENCLFRGNKALDGGGIDQSIAVGCTFVENSVRNNGAVAFNSVLRNCIAYQNEGCTQFCEIESWKGSLVKGLLPTRVNVYEDDPHFVDAANGDYRLAADSPCIDAGNNSYVVSESDLDGSGRIVNGKVDIGCYEYGSVGGPYVEKVGETNWTYMIKNGKASVGDGANAAVDQAIAGAVDVPTTLRTRPVVAIDDYALQGCTNMTSVTIPASVNTIGERAFDGCRSLADVYYEGETLSSIGVDAFRGCYWDLIMHVPTTWQGRGRTICGSTVWKGDDPNEVVRLVSTNVVVHYMTTNTPVEVVAPISQDTGIVNVMTEVKGGNVAIPDSWAKGFATFETKFGSDFTDALTRQTGKYDCNNTPMLVWQDYVAGTDPTNPDDTFTATITMVEGVPQVAWKPVLTEVAAAKRVYRRFGKVKLTDEWAEIPPSHEADYNFFKVTVEMK